MFSDPRDIGDELVFTQHTTDDRVPYGDELEPFIEEGLYGNDQDDGGDDGLMGYGGGGGAAVAERNDPHGFPSQRSYHHQDYPGRGGSRGQGEPIGAHHDPYGADPTGGWDPNPYQRGGGQGDTFYGPAEEEGMERPAQEEWMPPRAVPTTSGSNKSRWKKGSFTLSIEGSVNDFDQHGAMISLEDEYSGSQTFADIKKSKDYLGKIKVTEGRNGHAVTIGVKTKIRDDCGGNKIEGRHLCKGLNELISFDMFRQSQFNSTTPKTILERPKRVCQPILARYKNHRNADMRMFADPENLREKIVVDPSDPDKRQMIVPRVHPVAVELIKKAQRRCVDAGRPFNLRDEGFELSGYNYVISSSDVEAMKEDLRRDFNRTMYVSDLASFAVTFIRTQISRPTELKNKLKTNWRDTREIGAGLDLGTAEGAGKLKERFEKSAQIILTFEYEYLPHRLASN